MFLPRTPLPPQSSPQALLRNNTTARIQGMLSGPSGFTGQRGSLSGQTPAPGLIGPPIPAPQVQGNPGWGGNPQSQQSTPQGFTYEQLMRSAGMSSRLPNQLTHNPPPGFTYDQLMQSAGLGIQARQNQDIGPAAAGSGGGQPWSPGADIPPESPGGAAARRVLPFVVPYGLGNIPNIYHSINQARMNAGNRNWRESAQNAPVDPSLPTNSGPPDPVQGGGPSGGNFQIDPNDPSNPLNFDPDGQPIVEINPYTPSGQPPGAPTGLGVESSDPTTGSLLPIHQMYRNPMTGAITEYHDPNSASALGPSYGGTHFHDIVDMLGGQGQLGGDPTNMQGDKSYGTSDEGMNIFTGQGGASRVNPEGGYETISDPFSGNSNPYGIPQNVLGGVSPQATNNDFINSRLQAWMAAHGYGGQGRIPGMGVPRHG